MIIAIDGPAASGKGTLAKRLAERFGLLHLDTGLLYRATAHAVLQAGGDVHDRQAAVAAAAALNLSNLDERRLRGEVLGEAASIVAAMPEVRAALVGLQRSFAARGAGAVLDGRDIGSVIFPHADVKIFVMATPEARASRRYLELMRRGEAVQQGSVLADIQRRDERDSSRSAAPLQAAADAVVLDTTDLDIDAAFDAALAIVEHRLATPSSHVKLGRG